MNVEDIRPDSAPKPGPKPWSIGIYSGRSPFALAPPVGVENPVLSYQDVTDIPASFVADPFMVRNERGWHMFFEVMNRDTGRGEIALATSSDGFRWVYRQSVLAEPFHLSYPCVFGWRGETYMVPEGWRGGPLKLYRARRFPLEWSCVAPLLEVSCVDATPFLVDNRWWMFACTTPGEHKTLALYSAEQLEGPWIEHPASPLIENDLQTARPAGKVVRFGGRIFRLAQDCSKVYGYQVSAFEILELTTTSYREREHEANPVLAPGAGGWNGGAMHHLDSHHLGAGGWIACVDGQVA